MPATRLGPKALLSLCHEVDDLAEKIREFGSLPVQHLDEKRRRAIRRLLDSELFAAQAPLDLGELVRLVSSSKADLLARRTLVQPEGRLRQAGLICVEEDPAGKDAFASAWLPPGLTERLLGNLDPKGAIGTAEKESFREYLERPRGSDDFFRRL